MVLFWLQIIYQHFYFIYIYDEVYGKNNWNQYKLIQFEWFYKKDNTPNGLLFIRQWIMGKYNANNNNFDINYYYNNIIKKESKSQSKYSINFINKMEPLFKDCNDAIKNIILNKRPNLLIGDWIGWCY